MPFKNLEEFLSLFPDAKMGSSGRYKAHCPVCQVGENHKREDLSIWLDQDKILLKCFAMCDNRDIVASKGIELKDLFISDRTIHTGNKTEAVIDCTYDYTDEQDILLYQVVRMRPKDFWQRRPNGSGGWINSLYKQDPQYPNNPNKKIPAVRLVLFHLKRLKEGISKGKIIFICEGEKDVLNLEALGLYATCNPMGAGKWREEYNAMLAGARVIVIPDNDAPKPQSGKRPGIEHANHVCQSLKKSGNTVYQLTLPGGGIKDATDWVNAGGTKEALRDLINELDEWKPETVITVNQKECEQSDPYRFSLTDTGNAERLVSRFGKIIRHCYERNNYIVWNGEYWEWDSGPLLMDMAKQTARDIYLESNIETDDTKRKRLYKHAIESESQGKRTAMVNLARSEKGIPVPISKIDSDPWLFNVKNGTIDLKTGSLRPHKQDDLLTIMLPINYDADAKCTHWEAFLNTVTGNNSNMAKYLQRAVGYSLTGNTQEQCLFYLYGLGKNGKSTFVSVIRALMGNYGHKTNTNLFMVSDKKNSGPNEGLAELQGKRFVIASEIEDGQRLSVVLIKEMTGGESMRAERKYERGFEFQPTHKIWLSGNHRPIITDTTFSIWRRFKLIPFNSTIPENERIKDFDQILINKELPGILNWAITGCLEWQKSGLNEPNEVIDATEAYRHDQDVLGDFFDDCCITGATLTVNKKDLASEYEKWCTENKVKKPLSAKSFKNKLTEKGITEGRCTSFRYWVGITLKNYENQPQIENLTKENQQENPGEVDMEI